MARRYWGAALLALVVGLLLMAAALALQTRPAVAEDRVVSQQTVAVSKALLQRLLRQVQTAGQVTTLSINEWELQNLALLGSHSLQHVSADFAITGEEVRALATLELPGLPFGRYLNLSFHVAPSLQPLEIHNLRLGDLPLPDSWFLPLALRVAARYLPEEQASALLASITGIAIHGKTARLTVLPPTDLKATLKQTVRSVQTSRFPPGEQERVIHYYEMLADLGAGVWLEPHSFSKFLAPLLQEAELRRRTSSAVDENRAVIWALAIYFSNGKFENLVGDLVSQRYHLVFPAYQVTLAGRRDLMQHFLYSAAIALATQQGIGIAAGEFKELMDSGLGGSGFSFVDLAADRAGISFAETATGSRESARHLQEAVIDNPAEQTYFPPVSDLPEHLDADSFNQRYENIQSQAYQQALQRIDKRIAALPAYRKPA